MLEESVPQMVLIGEIFATYRMSVGGEIAIDFMLRYRHGGTKMLLPSTNSTIISPFQNRNIATRVILTQG